MPSADDGPAPLPTGCREVRAAPGRFPRSPPSVRRVSRPALPRQHRHAYAAGIQRDLRPRHSQSELESPPRPPVACTASGPYPPGWSRYNDYGASSTGSSRTASRLACRTRTVWQCQYVPALSGPLAILPRVSAVRLPSASSPCCDRATAEVFHLHPEWWRLRGARERRCIRCRRRVRECDHRAGPPIGPA